MATLVSAGLLMCRNTANALEFFLVHPGGPFFKNKDAGVWTIPKGLPNTGEALLDAAIREFHEETGLHSSPPYYPLEHIQQKGGKIVHAWMFFGDWSQSTGIRSNLFELEWPPRSGKYQSFPEQDRASWMNADGARKALIAEQVPFIDRAIIIAAGLKK